MNANLKIDWVALREQKRALLDAVVGGTVDADKLQGIVHLIDAIQEDAALRLGVVEVFGEELA